MSGHTIQPRDCRMGHLVSFQNTAYEILECRTSHTESVVTLKLRDLDTGAISARRFRGDAKLEQIRAIQRPAIYTHYDDLAETYVFLDSQTFEEIHISAAMVGDMSSYLVDGMEVDLSMYRGKTIQFGLNANWVAEVISLLPQTPSKKGKQQTHSRPVCLSNGKCVRVPMYIRIGDKVQVDPKTGRYVRRL